MSTTGRRPDLTITRRHALLAATALPLTACGSGRPTQADAGGTPSGGADAATAGPPAATPGTPGNNPFDALYDPGFTLTELSEDPIAPMAPPPRATGVDDAVLDPAYGTRLYRATSASDGDGGRMRHEYSRRQAFNADMSHYLAQDGTGAWHLYDGTGFTHLRVLEDLVGDCEPLWDAVDPELLHYTSRNGGTTWWTLNIATGDSEVLLDLASQSPWPEATAYWTKGEGTTSADGRVLTLVAVTYDEATQETQAHGVLLTDLVERRVVGTLDAADFPVPGAVPDHVSTSASGLYAVVSWLDGLGGTVAYNRDFSSSRELSPRSEHSDLAFGPAGEDYLVHADYGTGTLMATDLATGESIELRSLYPAAGEAYAVHVSAQCIDRPGWVVVSTYGDSADYGATQPAPTLRAEYRKVWLLELVAGGRALNVAHTRVVGDGQEDYFAEPQASASRDLSRIVFASDLSGEGMEDYVVALPSWVVD